MTKVDGSSWIVQVTYACSCGTHYAAARWRWIDRSAQPEQAERARTHGPVEGECPRCNLAASAHCEWLELDPSTEQATLSLGPQQRHRLPELLADHMGQVSERVAAGVLDHAPAWLLQPTWDFRAAVAGESAQAQAPAGSAVPKAVGFPRMPNDSDGESKDAFVANLTLDSNTASGEEIVPIHVILDEAGRALWGQAALQVRPLHLRDHGYPLIGVRVVASYLGRMALIDAVIDVGVEEAGAIFAALSRRFRVQLVLEGEGSSVVTREVSARDLERNAAKCLESARTSLARSEFPLDGFAVASESLRETAMEDRLAGAQHPLIAGVYRHLVAPRETWLALEHLEAASDKANLAHLIEVDGLAVEEYEAIRKRVLVASVEHGVCAPRRFWRRIIASGLAADFHDYAGKLARVRAQADSEGDDLSAEQRAAGWARIAELCDLKQLEYPPELAAKLGIEAVDPELPEEDAAEYTEREDSRETRSAAGEIGRARPASRPTAAARDELPLDAQLADQTLRVEAARSALEVGGDAVDAVFDSLHLWEEAEILAVMPSLAELGTQAVPSLHGKLGAEHDQVRQAAAILLGVVGDASSIVPLLLRLAREQTRVWLDVARSIGGIGPSALERLSALLRQSARGEQFPVEHRELIGRVGRAMAEVVAAGGSGGAAHDAVETLTRSGIADIANAARHALATLQDVTLAGAQIRGERSLPENTRLSGFARRAYEAIMVPEIDILDAEEVGVEFL